MIYRFEQVTPETTSSVGGKARNLGECARAGFPVPPGFVVPTECYLQATKAVADELAQAVANGDSKRARQLVASTALPHDLAGAVSAAYTDLGEPPVAVRSSATAEDLEHASFAGQQDTYLGVKGIDNVLDAIRRCWASLWTDRAIDYRRAQQVSSDGLALAVVVQEMVQPETAGVLFTRNPMSGSDEMMVSSSYGLGESVVAALVTPDTYVATRAPFSVVESQIGSKETRIDSSSKGGTHTSAVSPADQVKGSLNTEQLRKLIDMGERVEEHYGAGQDIEWAFAGESLYLLQARPITTRSEEVIGHAPTKGRVAQVVRDDLIEHYPAPYPLDLWAVIEIQDVVQNMLRSIGFDTPPADTVITGDDDGIVRITAKRPRLTLRLLRDLPSAIFTVLNHAPSSWPAQHLELQKHLEALCEHTSNASTSTDEDLLNMVDCAIAEAAATTNTRFHEYLAPMVILRGEAALFLKLSQLSSTFSVEDIYEGLDYVTAQVTRALHQLVVKSQELGVCDIIATVPVGRVQEQLSMSEPGATFLREVSFFLDEWGSRTTRMYLPFSNRSWREDPESLFALLSVAVRGGSTDIERNQSVLDSICDHIPRVFQRRWQKVVARLRSMHVGREGSLYMIEEFFCRARVAMDEIARRLVDRGVIKETEDIVYLYADEVRKALRSNWPSSAQAIVEKRRRKRGTAEALWWDRGDAVAEGNLIRGIPGSSGRTVGTARIVHGPLDFPRLQNDDVLVCPYTDPTWTPLFGIARAVVADTGGPLSHAAIVAREYGIPAVLGTQNGTSRLPDGANTVVDGTAGTACVEKAGT